MTMILNDDNTATARNTLDGLLSITATKITVREAPPSSGRSLVCTVSCSSRFDVRRAASDLQGYLEAIETAEMPRGLGWRVKGYR